MRKEKERGGKERERKEKQSHSRAAVGDERNDRDHYAQNLVPVANGGGDVATSFADRRSSFIESSAIVQVVHEARLRWRSDATMYGTFSKCILVLGSTFARARAHMANVRRRDFPRDKLKRAPIIPCDFVLSLSLSFWFLVSLVV